MKKQMSESFANSAVLALSGGLQDAYTYNVRGHVFANAQTGNVVLMSQNIMTGDLGQAVRYFIPLVAFALGIFVAENIGYHFKYSKKIHWRQGIVILEIALLLVAGFLPETMNGIANIIVSFSCAMQVQSFRTVNGHGFASTMCIGNLRAGTDAFSKYLREKKKIQLEAAGHYFGIILMFAIGAGLGGMLSVQIGIRTIWISCCMLLVSLLMMFRQA